MFALICRLFGHTGNWEFGHNSEHILPNGRICKRCGKFQKFDPWHGYYGPWTKEIERQDARLRNANR